MSALKSGQPGANKRRSKKAKGESSEDESDTEGEAGDDTSETDTVCWFNLMSSSSSSRDKLTQTLDRIRTPMGSRFLKNLGDECLDYLGVMKDVDLIIAPGVTGS